MSVVSFALRRRLNGVCPLDMCVVKTDDASMNQASHRLFETLVGDAKSLRGRVTKVAGSTILDLGVQTSGSLQAGVALARLCLGDRASVTLTPAGDDAITDWQVGVLTDDPVNACLGGQYAGWPVSVGDFFAMASGPMRMFRGREEMLEHLGLTQSADADSFAVGVLESDRLPGEDVITEMASACGVKTSHLCLAIAPSTSIAGSVQVVARSVETALHKLHALGFDMDAIVSATGVSPLPPPAKPGDTVAGIGRTNDAILYGSRVTLFVDAEDDAVEAVASKVPSETSSDHGRPFADIFKDYQYDFYKVDPMLFSPAVVTMTNLRSGRTWRYGRRLPQVLQQSFGQ